MTLLHHSPQRTPRSDEITEIGLQAAINWLFGIPILVILLRAWHFDQASARCVSRVYFLNHCQTNVYSFQCMYFIRRDNYTRPRLFYFTFHRRIKIDSINFKLLYHCHSSWSNSFENQPSNLEFLLEDLNCCSHPSRTFFSGEMRSPYSVTLNTRWVSSLKPSC